MKTQNALVLFLAAIATVAGFCWGESDTADERSARHDRMSEIAKRVHERDIDVENWPESMSESIIKK